MAQKNLLPASATPQERALSEAMARISDIPVPVDTLWNPWECPLVFLPWLAWALSVDEWDEKWTEKQKRTTVASSIAIHRVKGTRGAVRRAVEALGYSVTIEEWWEVEPKRNPFTFRLRIEVDDRGVDDALVINLERVACAAKNVRSHLDTIVIAGRAVGGVSAGSALMVGDAVTIQPWAVKERDTQGPAYVGAAVVAYETVTINPMGA